MRLSPTSLLNTHSTICSRRSLLRPRDEYSGVTTPTLRPGLYLVEPLGEFTGLVYIVFWPEDATWQDGAISSVSRNRVTFMRYGLPPPHKLSLIVPKDIFQSSAIRLTVSSPTNMLHSSFGKMIKSRTLTTTTLTTGCMDTL